MMNISKQNAIHDHPVGSVVTAPKTPNMEAWSFDVFFAFGSFFRRDLKNIGIVEAAGVAKNVSFVYSVFFSWGHPMACPKVTLIGREVGWSTKVRYVKLDHFHKFFGKNRYKKS